MNNEKIERELFAKLLKTPRSKWESLTCGELQFIREHLLILKPTLHTDGIPVKVVARRYKIGVEEAHKIKTGNNYFNGMMKQIKAAVKGKERKDIQAELKTARQEIRFNIESISRLIAIGYTTRQAGAAFGVVFPDKHKNEINKLVLIHKNGLKASKRKKQTRSEAV